MTDELIVLLEGRIAGRVHHQRNRLRFTYDDGWRIDSSAYPLSLSLPLTQSEHPDAAIRAFIWNLLPDNEQTLDRWGKQFQISARNPFALIGAVGEDCPGAVQFVRPDRLTTLLAGEADTIDWLDVGDVGQRLRSVLNNADSGRTTGENGQFSLAGAQSKTALLLRDGRWGIPSGRLPTTHILKPPARDMPGHAENEHLCLRLAAELGLTTANSFVQDFNGQPAIVVERYDRARLGDRYIRLHQEDMCQATATLPWHKYQSDGGPAAATIASLIRSSVRQPQFADQPIGDIAELDRWAFLRGLIYNWLIAGTDAHAKNYSLLIATQTVRLAPLYDIASALAFPDLQQPRMKMAMKIEYYLLDQIGLRHWARWARQARIDEDATIAAIRTMADNLPSALDRVLASMRDDGLDHPAIDRLAEQLPLRAERVVAQ